MIVFISFVILCGFGVLQGQAEDAVISAINLSGEHSSEVSDESRIKLPVQVKSMQEQYDIISLCTNIPSTYNDILNMYISTDSVVDIQDIGNRISKLKSRSQQLSQYVNTYSAAMNQPESYPVRKQMISAMGSLLKSLDNLSQNLNDEPQPETSDKVAFVQSDIKPALVDLQEACLAQTKDIVSNVLVDLKDNRKNNE